MESNTKKGQLVPLSVAAHELKIKRALRISSGLAAVLLEHRHEQEARRSGILYHDHGLVFASATGGPPDLSSLERNHFRRILKATGLPKSRVYDLRHSHASILLSRGVPVHIVSERLGHASPKVTLDVYAHTLPEDSHRLTGIPEDFVGGQRDVAIDRSDGSMRRTDPSISPSDIGETVALQL